MIGECNKSSTWSLRFAGLVAIVCSSVCIAAIADWSLPAKSASRDRAAVAESPPKGMNSVAGDAIAAGKAGRAKDAVSARDGVARLKAKCAGCGIIESIRKIEVDERTAGRCAISDLDGTHLPAILLASRHKEVVSLADAVVDAIGGDENARKPRRITGYQIVVRFRDGTRHVFTETTPRSLRLGDRVLVVAPPRLDG